MGLLSALFGQNKKKEMIADMMDRGAIIIDVRNPNEFKSGHIEGSKNIPLKSVPSQLSSIKKLNKPIVLCCVSGVRSAQATQMLKKEGIEAVNGGGWRSLQ